MALRAHGRRSPAWPGSRSRLAVGPRPLVVRPISALGLLGLVLVAGAGPSRASRWSSTRCRSSRGRRPGPATLALVSMATRRRWREIIPVGILSLTSGLVLRGRPPVDNDPCFTIPFIVAVIAVTVGWGMYIGSRRELLASLRERADTAEAEQAARLAQARAAERTRIAREMHDVLAHRISLVTMHAGALSYRNDLTPTRSARPPGSSRRTHTRRWSSSARCSGCCARPGDSDPERPSRPRRPARAVEEARTPACTSSRRPRARRRDPRAARAHARTASSRRG